MKKDYRFLTSSTITPPPFFGKLTTAVAKSWESLGSVCCKINKLDDGYEVVFFPALREVCGGKDDGCVIFPGFNFNIGRFVKVFDQSPAPKVHFDSLRKALIPHLQFKGNIDNIPVKVRILECPLGGQKATERVYTNGPKKGKVEVIEQ